EDHLKSELKFTRPTASERGVVVGYIRRGLRRPETCGREERIVPADVVELRIAVLHLVQKIENFGSELAFEFLCQLPVLDPRAAPRVQTIASKHIPTHIAVASDRRRHHYRMTPDKTAPLLKRHVT